MMVLYLGISGVLHPSWSFYRYVHGREADQDGHRKFESVKVLDQALSAWPSARIVLTSTQPWSKGLEPVLEQLGPLARRVDGFTFKDLTESAPVDRLGRCISEMDYWRLVKSQIVRRHVEWLKPDRWVALDDEDIGWTEDELPQVVITSGLRGLADPTALDRLYSTLEYNFGAPVGG